MVFICVMMWWWLLLNCLFVIWWVVSCWIRLLMFLILFVCGCVLVWWWCWRVLSVCVVSWLKVSVSVRFCVVMLR